MNTTDNDMLELLQLFVRNCKGAGGQVSVIDGAQDAALLITAMADGEVTCSAAVPESYSDVYEGLRAQGIAVTISEEVAAGRESGEDRARLASALAGGVGVVTAIAGVAETGSVVQADNSLSTRLLGMLADTCVVLVLRSAILRDLDEAGALIADMDRRGHHYISLVTGPSRTADIERVLTIGVQGPKALHVIVL
ncbi:MAG: lactate utilization protein [Chloroflexota bacterium]|nr:lactate utilization protein [Chloroflexota bacterium]